MSDYLLFLRNLVKHLNTAMSEEHIEDDVRRRVISRLMYGEPETDSARAYVEQEGPNPGLSGPGW